jgi:hypothetical protein
MSWVVLSNLGLLGPASSLETAAVAGSQVHFRPQRLSVRACISVCLTKLDAIWGTGRAVMPLCAMLDIISVVVTQIPHVQTVCIADTRAVRLQVLSSELLMAIGVRHLCVFTNKTNSVALSPQANYTD